MLLVGMPEEEELLHVLEEMEEEEDELEVVAVEQLLVAGVVVELMGGVVDWFELLVSLTMMTAKMWAMMKASLDLYLPLLLYH